MMKNGYLLVILSAVMYGIEPTFIGLALDRGISPEMATLFTTAVSLPIFLCRGLIRKASFRVGLRQGLRLLLLGMLMALTNMLLASSYRLIPVGCATVIHFMYPTITCLVMTVFFHRRLVPLRAAAILCSITGMVLITGGGIAGDIHGGLLALFSSFTYVAYVVLTDRSRELAGLDIGVRMFYIGIGTMLTAGLTALRNPAFPVMQGSALVYLLLCGIMLTVAHASFAMGVDRIGATSASFFSLFEPVTSMLVSFLVYHYQLGWMALAGCGLTMLSVLCVSAADHKEAR